MGPFAAFGGHEYFALLSLLVLSRGADLLSTWIATPSLAMEGNPLARRLGWRWGGAVNLAVCAGLALWPLVAIMIATVSLLIAARHFQMAWLMRSLGEEAYRKWYRDRLLQASRPLYLGCLAGQTLSLGAIGGALLCSRDGPLIPVAIGMGIIGYALTAAFYALLAVRAIHPRTH
jgi:hypothetical protein